MQLKHWILENRVPVEADLLTWGRWFENIDNRRVALTTVLPYRISTVFLGIDHNYGSDGPPLLFETMVFNDGAGVSDRDVDCVRYATWAEAQAGHNTLVRKYEAQSARIDAEIKVMENVPG